MFDTHVFIVTLIIVLLLTIVYVGALCFLLHRWWLLRGVGFVSGALALAALLAVLAAAL